jgi:H+/Cl- antiporter ClcA
MDSGETMLVWIKDKNTQNFIEKDNEVAAWLFYSFYSVLLVLIATIMTLWWGPGSAGSGVAEVIGYVNGVNYLFHLLNFAKMITKNVN